MKIRRIYVFPIIMSAFIFMFAGFLHSEEISVKLAAKGDNVEVSMEFIRMMQQFYEEHTVHRAQEKELIRSGVEHWLFAREAVLEGLAEAESDPEKMEPKEVVLFYNMYLTHLMLQENLEDNVLLSYYHAFPNRFVIKIIDEENESKINDGDGLENSEPSETISEEKSDQKEMIPFEEAKDFIRRTLLAARIPYIKAKAFDDLIKKYNVTIFN